MMWNGDRDIVDIDQYKAFISMEWMDLTTSAIWYRNFQNSFKLKYILSILPSFIKNIIKITARTPFFCPMEDSVNYMRQSTPTHYWSLLKTFAGIAVRVGCISLVISLQSLRPCSKQNQPKMGWQEGEVFKNSTTYFLFNLQSQFTFEIILVTNARSL